ncbi:prepilin-type N-terminal cleavage/methylation domain-containing protein [Paenibacillus sp. UNCCL117]|uniref:type IV pilus modification PilV family protein n=1 Tax=unclassified Paenibacillus TaxID=185978 RepID=UPI000888315C|nr:MULTISPECIES: prepilin-type N-terminal cleavage/methylation domain-containing protein [unclassified Paenibacillus]SDC47061.1 prepilin-type N-terminal cleavage/methylation domain-containing protein [Paenibacillus sp. cl123]SFW12199.1 prepilin-type N-terminal cleavage/methylation domain-containing protein [Paenibacillus sp. UNCCL117]
MVKNQKGLTLVEILASIVILAMVILAFTYMYNNLFAASTKEQRRDVSVDIARSVMEQLKTSFSTGAATMNIWFPPAGASAAPPGSGAGSQQSVDLTALRQVVTAPYTADAIYYPSAADRQYKVQISNVPIPEAGTQKYTLNDGTTSYTLNVVDHFSLIQVEVIAMGTGVSYSIQSYLDRSP